MVKLEIINDDSPAATQEKPVNDHVESDSEDEYDEDDFDVNESITDRLVALRDIVPPQVRAQLSRSVDNAYGILGSAVSLGGTGLWILTSATLLFGIPFGLCLAAEEQLSEMENSLAMGGAASDNMLAPEGQTKE